MKAEQMTITFRVPERLNDKLIRSAQKIDISKSELLRRIIWRTYNESGADRRDDNNQESI